ncbi:MAG: hypothetical protein K6T59_02370 [Bryobacteraceae bacterium]|nr:hypothetical protein [Bryobacteraceae bacterium]
MPLFTDGTASDVADLRAYDAAIAEIAAAEGVELKAKLDLAMAEIGLEIEEFLERCGSGAADLSQVVITPALKQWHILHTLSLVYGDIHNSHVSRRFEQKWQDYKARSRWAAETLFRVGVGLVWTPIPKADPPELRPAAGILAPGTYVVRAAWVSLNGEEGAASEAAICVLSNPGAIAVRLPNAPATAAGYHVYAGNSGIQVFRQTAAPVPVNQEWIVSSVPDSGAKPPTGQQPHRYVRHERILQRG